MSEKSSKPQSELRRVVGIVRRFSYVGRPARFRLAACLSRLNPSRARRFAVRTSAAARDAFFARAERSSAVRFLADALPPWRPNMRAISVMAARTSGGIFIPSMVHLTVYGEDGRKVVMLRFRTCNVTASDGSRTTGASVLGPLA